MRDPNASDWNPDHPRGAPEGKHGDYTKSPEVAAVWRLAYAAAWENAKIRKQSGIVDVVATERPLGREMDAYLSSRDASTRVRDGLAWDTVSGDQTTMRLVERWYGRDVDLASVQPGELNARLAQLIADGFARGTVKNHARRINGFLKSVGVAPFATLPAGRERHERKDPWTDEEVEILRRTADGVDAAGGDRGMSARLALELALGTGAREGELFALTWERLAPGRGTVSIAEQLLRRANPHSASRIGETKGREPRLAVVLPDFWEFYRPGERGLILHTDGRAVGYQARQAIKRLATAAGVKQQGEGTHMTRHTYSRWFLEAGGSIEDLSKSLGHKDLGTTQRYYGHLRPQVAADRAAAIIYRTYGAELRRISA